VENAVANSAVSAVRAVRVLALGALLAALLLVPRPGAAQDTPLVVVELFTSQGCSACPPADRLLKKLTARDDILPLALHVDYWDYIGWEDAFARPEHTARQKAYARAAGHRTVYTPQMVVGGRDHVAGADAKALDRTLLAHRARPARVTIGLEREGDDLNVLIVGISEQLPDRMVVQLARYTPAATVTILRGENADHTLDYVNIVDSLDVVASWDGHAPLALTLPVPGPEPAAILVQTAGHGPIVGAAVLR
jgi:hypothetical protein